MNEGLIPRRYAKAIYEHAVENGDAHKIYDLMKNLACSFVDEEGLHAVLNNPFVSSADKAQLIATAANAKKADVSFADFIKLLMVNKRLDMARGIALAYIDLYRKANNIYLVDVVTASPLSNADEERMKSLILAHLKGGSMEYNHRVDSQLIGGFVINIGSERLDASINNELKQLRLKLLSN